MLSIYELWSHEHSNTQLVALEDLGPVQIFSDPSANQGLQIWTRRVESRVLDVDHQTLPIGS